MDDVAQTLNSLLEAERAAVEALVDLTRMSADIVEREVLQQIGGDEAWACASLREQIEALGGVPSRRVGPLLAQMRAREHFPARLRLLAQHQQSMLESFKALLDDSRLPEEVRVLLAELYRIHVATIAWCEQRVAAFGVRDVPKDQNPAGRPGEGRPSNEGRLASHRNRNKRQLGYGNKPGEISGEEPLFPPQLTNMEGGGPG
jgi:hypothetical protein